MASPAYWGKLANFTAGFRKPALIAFGTFSPGDNLGFIATIPPPAGYSTFVPVTIAFSANLVIDTATGDTFSVVLTGNAASTTLTFNSSATIPQDQRAYLRFTQDATGGRTVVLPALLVADTGFAVDPTPSRTTVLPIMFNGTNWVFFSSPFSVTGS